EAFDRHPRIVAPGAVWLPGFLSDRAQSWILARCAEWQSGPVPPHATTLAGPPVSVRTLGPGWHWRPGRYDRRAVDVAGAEAAGFPEGMTRQRRRVLQAPTEVVDGAHDRPPGTAASWGFDATGYHPDVALVNHHDEQAKTGMHQHKDE